MNGFIRAIRWTLKQPVLLFIFIVSKYKGFTIRDRYNVPSQLSYLFEYYEPETTRFFKKHIKRGMTVIDAGANVGYFAHIFARLVGPEGKVYAFEPDQENLPFLYKNTARFKNVTVMPYALSDEDGEVAWYHVVGANESHTLVPDPIPVKKNYEKQIVRAVTLDSSIKEKINMLKLDVEGVEDRVFRGMKRHLAEDKPTVVFEYTVGYLDDFVNGLKKTGKVQSLSLDGDLQDLEKARYALDGRKEFEGAEQSGRLANIVYQPN